MKRPVLLALVVALASPFAGAATPSVGQLLRSVPADARVIVAVDSAALRVHPKVQEWLLRQHAWTGADQELHGFLSDAGLDPLRDVDAMVVAVLGEGDTTHAVALFAGRYDPAALGAALVKRGAQPYSLGKTQAYRLASSGEHHGARGAILAQPAPDLVIVGDRSAVDAALMAPHAIAPLAQGEIAAGHIDVRAPFWVVATVPPRAQEKAREAVGSAHGEGTETVRSVMFASGAITRVAIQAFLDDSLRFSGVAVADTAENAELLRDAVKGAIAAARLHAQGTSPELVNVLRNIDVSVSGTDLSASGAVPVSLVEKLVTEHGHHCQPTPVQ
jgi:hypothetical protein